MQRRMTLTNWFYIFWPYISTSISLIPITTVPLPRIYILGQYALKCHFPASYKYESLLSKLQYCWIMNNIKALLLLFVL